MKTKNMCWYCSSLPKREKSCSLHVSKYRHLFPSLLLTSLKGLGSPSTTKIAFDYRKAAWSPNTTVQASEERWQAERRDSGRCPCPLALALERWAQGDTGPLGRQGSAAGTDGSGKGLPPGPGGVGGASTAANEPQTKPAQSLKTNK